MTLKLATLEDTEVLMPLVRAYHEFEGISTTDLERRESVTPLLRDPDLGRIWLIEKEGQVLGYIALCFGYSIEFGGRDAFLDEFFIAEAARSHGIGRIALEAIKNEAAKFGVRVIHLEVARTNLGAKQFYAKAGFAARERFHMMSCRLDTE
ncbi:MAG TPA: GNAT family N-acetyltransferase [Sphingomicrobium sp.]|nr:GNAT family N-acetyltransferase [Sphingomicrobium sp.]